MLQNCFKYHLKWFARKGLFPFVSLEVFDLGETLPFSPSIISRLLGQAHDAIMFICYLTTATRTYNNNVRPKPKWFTPFFLNGNNNVQTQVWIGHTLIFLRMYVHVCVEAPFIVDCYVKKLRPAFD
jgi:hypothetical protein